ncbi:helix-turn-helix domain-containing protein [Natrialba taiwanensis]|uniref:DNA binding protein n=1 Tax=Natrialba taiwanensis DSM 12281 TaxID=1230458 RepID=M0A974_9EURY|nr:helix-turn-helix domain-containing protein [Natrialba taiwanensis]ELY94437.1 DNA binding protein [Natrialba taiwanensis DSM 12281]
MRYLTVLVHPAESGSFHPLGETLSNASEIEREAIHHVEHLADDTVLLFAEGSGDRDRYEDIMRDSPHVVDYFVSGVDRWMAVSQFEPTDATRCLLERQHESNVVIETPIYFTADGSLRITYLGSDAAFRELFRGSVEETAIAFDVVETGDYNPDEAALTRQLTTRQREVLEVAVEIGYYSAPRQSTLDDVADVVGIATSTAGEHLRKVEESVFGAFVR